MENKIPELSKEELDRVSGGAFRPSGHTVEVKKSNCYTFIRSAEKAMLLAGAPWCGPAQLMCANIDSFAESNRYLEVGILNADLPENHSLVDQLNITSIPITIHYKNGVEVHRTTGVVPVDKLAAF